VHHSHKVDMALSVPRAHSSALPEVILVVGTLLYARFANGVQSGPASGRDICGTYEPWSKVSPKTAGPPMLLSHFRSPPPPAIPWPALLSTRTFQNPVEALPLWVDLVADFVLKYSRQSQCLADEGQLPACFILRN
jgi:uncharacterized protein (DUF608 family)